MTHTKKSDDLPEPPPPPDRLRRELCGVGAMALFLSACGGSDSPGMPATIPAPPPPAPTPTPTPTPPPPGLPPAGAPPPPMPSPPPPAGLSCGAVAISGNHGHTLVVPEADLDSTTNKSYNIRGSADHNHTVVLTPAQLQLIKAKTAALVNSSTEQFHFHEVTVNCS